jgi:hypothetical protein
VEAQQRQQKLAAVQAKAAQLLSPVGTVGAEAEESGMDWLSIHVVGLGRVVFETDDALAIAALLSKHHRLKALV